MELIKTLLVFEKDSTVIKYPTVKSFWRNTRVSGGFLVGDYDGALFLADGITKTFEWEYHDETPDYGRILSVLSLRERFTFAEKALLDLYSIDDPSLDTEARLQKATVRQLFEELRSAPGGVVDLDYLPVQQGIKLMCEVLQQSGHIANADERFNQIIHAPVRFDELIESARMAYL